MSKLILIYGEIEEDFWKLLFVSANEICKSRALQPLNLKDTQTVIFLCVHFQYELKKREKELRFYLILFFYKLIRKKRLCGVKKALFFLLQKEYFMIYILLHKAFDSHNVRCIASNFFPLVRFVCLCVWLLLIIS